MRACILVLLLPLLVSAGKKGVRQRLQESADVEGVADASTEQDRIVKRLRGGGVVTGLRPAALVAPCRPTRHVA